ncbi:tRNA uridine(34) 5-carboxymethylaminomethyl modification radical SAM/GNAT enzyme Elp3 [Candidatus Woesearchaeota archaeon]|jgi:elongator complex protein 3|nr:tRNA uridine(34) 5-carboxymethylaminomethyl modification radical SAM/GNAT enzyme Elp3 [Candidatus Woesearchaeota archaeon]MBT4368649.1 tRNA uridine(34) 5-carboxymethylaminomethyl modification radical SAM/GNAT enzyme Elp3 [Candidatus Woesearchaeota archaeon]MBT4712204.1 tRNA uridine(34) 5-carboxymethylaminomethyl modification radical SAM/GNAT enzyme Elp3 [Candidatus Woesearchaeota archaeon]MBT6638964.1 tRNA uridine(34) 5-carboxymethylaminomethyl modification radical SAM/GNAT enzyme Elp3 [Candi
MEKIVKEIIREIKKNKITTQIQLSKLKLKIARKYHLKKVPNNVELSNHASDSDREKLKHLLTIKPIRTLAGVAPVALMTPPHECPHGKCDYCPGGPNSEFGSVPQSYTGKEPATRRAIRNKYDPYLQVFNRLEQYVVMNKVPDKAEVIVMGGTFPSLPVRTQDHFIKFIFKALNDFSKIFYKNKKLNIKKFNTFFEIKKDINDLARIDRIQARILKEKKKNKVTLKGEQLKNESSKIRCVALTIETRPDYCNQQHVNQLLKLGCTKVELGVQTTKNSVLKSIKRGHTVEDAITATKLLKDACFKVTYHIMPGLPGVNAKQDLNNFKELFLNPDFKPDMLKIYPCMVLKGTNLFKLYKQHKFKPLTTKKATSLISEMKSFIPRYVRVMRVQRDIPSYMVEAGVDRTNLRQYIDTFMKKKNWSCNCIRCNEIGRKPAKGKVSFDYITYSASDGIEFFIYAEIKDSLVGFARLRFPSDSFRKEITQNAALLRELHVYGMPVPIGEKSSETQHKGVGKNLLHIAEKIAKTYYKDKMVVISGIGVRPYYKNKLGYKQQGPYVVKQL